MVIGLVATGLMLASCTGIPSPTKELCSDTSSFALPSDWVEVTADSEFSLWAPPGTTYQPIQGIDSFVGEFRAANFTITFDLGRYNLSPDDLWRSRRYRPTRICADEFAGTIALSRVPGGDDEEEHSDKYDIHLLVVTGEQQMPNSEGITFSGGPDSLHMWSWIADDAEAALLTRIYRTVRFAPKR